MVSKRMSSKNNPLKNLWSIINSIGGVIGLSSLAENWLTDLVKWKSWIATVIDTYQRVVYPLCEWLFEWLPWAIPTWGIDYLVLGAMFITSMWKGLAPPVEASFSTIFSETRWFEIPIFIIFFVVQTLIWPFLFLIILRNYYANRASDTRDALLWFVAIFFGFSMLISVNAAI